MTKVSNPPAKPPPRPHTACQACDDELSPAWFRWEGDEGPVCGLRIACEDCHAQVRDSLDGLLAVAKRMSLAAVRELVHRLQKGPPRPEDVVQVKYRVQVRDTSNPSIGAAPLAQARPGEDTPRHLGKVMRQRER